MTLRLRPHVNGHTPTTTLRCRSGMFGREDGELEETTTLNRSEQR